MNHITKRSTLILVLISLLLFFSLSACSKDFASFDGGKISQEEVDKIAKEQLGQLAEQVRFVKKQAGFQLLFKQLLDKEAAGKPIETYFSTFVNKQKDMIPQLWVELYTKLNYPAEKMTPEVANRIRNELASRNMRLYRDILYLDLVKKYNVRFQESKETNKERKNFDSSKLPVLGPDKASITIVAFTDFQCPYCKQAFFTIHELIKRYPNQIRYVYADFPLDFHKQGKAAAHGFRCAGEQKKFWEYHDALFLLKSVKTNSDLDSIAKAIQLNMVEYAACMKSNKYMKTIDEYLEKGQKLGVSGTPAFFINGKSLSGALPLSEFLDHLKAEGLNP